MNKNLEKATEITKNVTVLGDFNDDVLLSNNYNLKNVLLVNSLRNVISEPTKRRALLDPIIVDFDQTVLDYGVLSVSSEISDHKATFIEVPFEYTFDMCLNVKFGHIEMLTGQDVGSDCIGS